jgi:hypothetical protein
MARIHGKECVPFIESNAKTLLKADTIVQII